MSKYIVREIKNSKEWDNLIISSNQSIIFHRYGWLSTIIKNSNYRVQLLGCYYQDKLISCFPIFIAKLLFGNLIFSPPPHFSIPQLGPIYFYDSKSNYDIEKLYKDVSNEYLKFIYKNYYPNYISIITITDFYDIRPFIWSKMLVKPIYTYYLDLSPSEDTIFSNLKKQMRTDIRRASKYEEIEIVRNKKSDFDQIVAMTRNRYSSQNKNWKVSNRYLSEIYDEFHESMEIIGAYNNNELLTGLILLKDKITIRHWIGGISYNHRFIGINEMLHWESIKKFKTEGYEKYEFMGANTENLCKHKSKYDPELKSYFSISKIKVVGDLIFALYR